jgi:hypothetical protein
MKKATNRKINKNLFVIINPLLAILIVGTTLFLTTDIYINRGHLAKKQFSEAFMARITGNCESFDEFVIRDLSGWRNKCLIEKHLETDPLYGFTVLNVTVRGDKAFLQTELVRGANEDTYPVTYELLLVDGKWFINQDAN